MISYPADIPLSLTALGLAAAGLVVLTLALLGFLYLIRSVPLRRVIGLGESPSPPAVADPAFRSTIELLTGISLRRGCQVEVLLNGDETFSRMWHDMRSARHSISFQTYFGEDGDLAESLRELLMERARAGVQVRLLYDDFGSPDFTGTFSATLRASGVEVARLRPLRWYSLYKAQNRSHVRAAIIDGVVAYTGGFGIADKWLGNVRTSEEWRETNVRFSGPAAAQMQGAFLAAWAEVTGQLLTGDDLLGPGRRRSERKAAEPGTVAGTTAGSAEPGAAEQGPPEHEPALTGVLFGVPNPGSTQAERFLALSIAAAREELYITNSYFAPSAEFRRFLTDAAAGGVDVRVLVPGDRTDQRLVRYAAYHHFDGLLSAGVRIYEFQPSMIHAKTFVADGLWSCIGSLNFDTRSLAHNDEAVLAVLDPVLGARMRRIFLDDLERARELTLAGVRRRPAWAKARDAALARFTRLI